MSSSASKKRSASSDADEASSSQRPRVAPGQNRFSSVFGIDGLLTELVEKLPARDIQSLRDTTKALNKKIVEVPKSLAAVNPTQEARDYAEELLGKDHVREFLVNFFFPLEEELNKWLHTNEDLIQLFDRTIPLQRNFKGNVLYKQTADLRGEGDESFADSEFRACPANEPFCRSFHQLRNMERKIVDVAARVRELDHLNQQGRVHFQDIWQYFETEYNKYKMMTGLYDDAWKTKDKYFFSSIRQSEPMGDTQQEIDDSWFRTVGIPSWLSTSYEHFVKVTIPLLLTTFRVQIVYTQCSFSVVDKVYQALTGPDPYSIYRYAVYVQRYLTDRFQNEYKRIPPSAFSPDSTIRQQTISLFFKKNEEEEVKELQPSGDELFEITEDQMAFAYDYEVGLVYIEFNIDDANINLPVELPLGRLKSKHILEAARDRLFRDTLRNKIYRPPTEAIPDYDTDPNALVRRLEIALRNINLNLSKLNLKTAQ